MFGTRRRLAALLCWMSCCTACQALTKLDTLDVSASPADAAVDAAVAIDAAPPQTLAPDAGPAPLPESHCLVAEAAQCDLVQQCGCGESQHCQARTTQRRPTCVTPGSNAPWSACDDARECPKGQTCDRGSCRPYCRADGDCDGGACFASGDADSSQADAIQVCWKRCEIGANGVCANGTTCRSVKTPNETVGSYCVAPSDPCPTTDDGRCDESKAGGTCAEGTDRKDCECTPTLPGASCDPVTQCGCARGLNCQAETLDTNTSDDNVITFTATCVKPGSKTLHAECADPSECALGLTCDLSVRMCVNYCNSGSQCGSGACKKMLNDDDPELGICTPSCDRESDAPCPAGISCATFGSSAANFFISKPGDYCWEPVAECPINGTCDEPQGTALCVAGSDRQDCCGAPRGAECNHVTGCGCESMPGTRCTPFFGSPSCLDGDESRLPPWSACDSSASCPTGYGCGEGVCRKYCADDADCGEGGLCYWYTDFNSRDVVGVGACFIRCDFAQENSCPEPMICGQRNPPNAYCIVPYDSCPASYIGNGRCDDPRPGGTRACAMGTDPDCDAIDE